MVHDVCIYTRISHDPYRENGAEGLGVARQEEDCRALARRQGWRVGRVFTDNDISAFSGATRPAFEEMLDAIKRGEYDALVCWHTDRLYRSIRDMERVIEVCEAAEVPIRTVNGGDLDVSNATGKAVARILGSVSRMESEHKAERQRRANLQRAEAGLWSCSRRVFGYTDDHQIYEPEAVWIRQSAADLLAGVSLRAISRRLNEAGITTTRGSQWNGIRLRRMLANPRYAALRTYRGKVMGPGTWPAIVDTDTHHGIVAVLADNTEKTGTIRFERKYIGSFRYVCGRDEKGRECGAPMHHSMTTYPDGRRGGNYRCTRKSHLSRSQPKLDEYVERVALAWMRDEKRIAKILAAKKPGTNKQDPRELRTRRAALAAQKDELATLFTEGVLDGPGVRRESAKLHTKISAIDAELAELARRSPLSELMSEGLDTLEKRWADLTPDLKGKILDELFVVVVKTAPRGPSFNPDYIEFRQAKR